MYYYCSYYSERAKKRHQILVSRIRWSENRRVASETAKKGHHIPGTAPGVIDLSDATETSHQWQLVNPAGEEEAQEFSFLTEQERKRVT